MQYTALLALTTVFSVLVSMIAMTSYASEPKVPEEYCGKNPQPGVNWSNCNLEGAKLDHLDLQGADLSFVNLRGADLTYTKLEGADLTGADLRNAVLYAADLTRSKLDGVKIQGADLRFVNLSGLDLTDLALVNIDLYASNLTRTNLQGKDLSHVNFYYAQMSYANLKGADLSYTNLDGATMLSVNLDSAKLEGASIRGVELSYSSLDKANIVNANLPHSKLRQVSLLLADLRNAALDGADLSFANLRGADLENAHIVGAKLRHADLSDANLDHADLTNANLRYANFTNANLYGVRVTGIDSTGAIAGPKLDTQVGSSSLIGDVTKDWKIYELAHEGNVFRIPYNITNGHIKEILGSSYAAIITIESSDGGMIVITLPREIIDPELFAYPSDDYYVEIDSRQIIPKSVSSSICSSTIMIDVPHKSEEILISGGGIEYPPSVPVLYIDTDEDEYVLGDEIIVSGCASLTLHDKEVTIEILNPEGELYKRIVVTPNVDGSFSTSLVVDGENAVDGTYTAKATYAGESATSTFVVPEFPISIFIASVAVCFMLAIMRLRSVRVFLH